MDSLIPAERFTKKTQLYQVFVFNPTEDNEHGDNENILIRLDTDAE